MNELRDMMHLPTESEREEQKIMDRIEAVVVGRDKRIAKLEGQIKRINTPLETSSEWKKAIDCIGGLEDEVEKLEAQAKRIETLPATWIKDAQYHDKDEHDLIEDLADQLQHAIDGTYEWKEQP